MEKTVFWSWQSVLDARVTREVICYALDEVIKPSLGRPREADRPTPASDTQGVAGSPDIVATILAKIDEAAVFVADVTLIATSAKSMACANPNVLLEMGYANKALGPKIASQPYVPTIASCRVYAHAMGGGERPSAFGNDSSWDFTSTTRPNLVVLRCRSGER